MRLDIVPPAILAYAIGLATMIALDVLWLGVIALPLYESEIGALLLESPRWPAAVLFYLGYVAGVMLFAVGPGLAAGSARRTAGLGALLGLFAYGTYDLTNLATLKGFTVTIAMVDMAWGAAITTAVAVAAHAAARRATTRAQM